MAGQTVCACHLGVMNNMAQGDNIKCLRTREGLTQQQFADMLGVTKETVCRWERGHTAVKVSTLDKLTELLPLPA
mgnify:FL=1